MRILGIDPGIAITGYGVIDKKGNRHEVIDYGAIITSSKDEHYRRLFNLWIRLNRIVTCHSPTHMAVEKLFFSKNVKTAMAVSEARGVILLSAYINNLTLYEYTPPEVKSAVCGYGKADKKQVQQMVKTLLKLETIPKPDDVADALAIAICHSHAYKIKRLSK